MSWLVGTVSRSLLLAVLVALGVRWIRSRGEVWHSLPGEPPSGAEGP